ncbi:MAG: PepSY-associated TM helix domain-containing protein [Chthoniobacteraceae bacterium]
MKAETKHHLRLVVRVWTRNLHIYISMFGLLGILFFSVTGIMLNHEDWFGFSELQTHKTEGAFPPEMLKGKEPDKLVIVEKLRKDFGATGALNSFDVQSDQLDVVFKSPARRAEAVIDRPGGHIEMTYETHGLAGRIAELHRGTDAGPVWSYVIDITAILLTITSLTGLILWLLVPKWRPLGLTALGLCIVICAVIYFVYVP